MSQLDGFTTLSGKTFEEVHERLRLKLPDDAYKQHPVKTFLTDINPTYLYEALNDVFGPCGIGWGIDYPTDTDAVQIFSEERESDRRSYRMWVANVKRAEFWYAYVMDDSTARAIIPTTGSSENEDYAYALRGALTAAVSGACKWLEWQFHIYSGESKASSTPQTLSRGSQKPPAGKPELFVMPFGKNKGKTLAQIKTEDFGYLTWLAEKCDKEDIQALAKQVIGQQPAPSASPMQSDTSKELLDEIWARFVALGADKVDTINKSLEGQGYPAIDQLSEQQAGEVIKRLRAKHWKHDKKSLSRFWAEATEMGYTETTAHEALNCKSLEDYTGDIESAIKVLKTAI